MQQVAPVLAMRDDPNQCQLLMGFTPLHNQSPNVKIHDQRLIRELWSATWNVHKLYTSWFWTYSLAHDPSSISNIVVL